MERKKIMTSKKKVAANRLNGQKSHGPKNTTSTCFNATKHGLLAEGITELDETAGYRTVLNDLIREKNPVGTVETFLVTSAAMDMLRCRRARRLEAEFINADLHPPIIQEPSFVVRDKILDPGLPASTSPKCAQRLFGVFQRYETAFVNRILRLLHELERLQRMRGGEKMPAPAVVDVSVHASASSLPDCLEKFADNKTTNSATTSAAQPKSVSGEVEVDVHADAEIGDSVPKALEQPKAIPGSEE